jgi:hypothetical protein
MKSAWWNLTVNGADVSELDEFEREQIADWIKGGFTEGEVIIEE